MQKKRHIEIGGRSYRLPTPYEYCFCQSSKKFNKCCMNKLVIEIGGGSRMRLQEIAGISIYRPRPESERKFRSVAETHLREKFSPGTYTDYAQMDAIIKWQVELFGKRFDDLIPKIASRSFMDFLMFQYEQSGVLDEMEKSGALSGTALVRWHDLGRTFKRTIKYVAERTTMLAPIVEPTPGTVERLDLLDEIFIYAEELVGYCILSDQTRLFPNTTQMLIQEPGEPTVLDHEMTDTSFNSFDQRIIAHRNLTETIYGDTPYHVNVQEHSTHLGEAFESHLGVSYLEALAIISNLLKLARPNSEKDNFATVFVSKEKALSSLSQMFKKPEATLQKVIDGFALTQEDMTAEGRDYWNPQFHYRAYRRGIFCMPHVTGPHFSWSKRLYSESLRTLVNEVTFGHFPKEWQTEEINKRIGDLVRQRGEWFEHEVQKHLSRLGIIGLTSRESIGAGKYALSISVGEFDFIGWCPLTKSLILLECKMMQDGTEPRMWKNQVDAFTKDTKSQESFARKLAKKAKWLASNAIPVANALRSEGIPVDDKPECLYAGFVTYAPSAASYFVKDFPCVSLPELITDYGHAGRWPYTIGKQKCQQH